MAGAGSPKRNAHSLAAYEAETIATVGKKNNMFYQWLEYSARQVGNKTCTACHRKGGIPAVRPLPGVDSCDNRETCFVECVMRMMVGVPSHSNYTEICPVKLPINLTETGEYQVPPAVKLVKGTVFPFCTISGGHVGDILLNTTKINHSLEAEYSLRCKYDTYHYKWSKNGHTHRLTAPTKICSTTQEAKFQCAQVIDAGGGFILGKNQAPTKWVRWSALYNLKSGTQPLADIFWLCDTDPVKTCVTPQVVQNMCPSNVDRTNNHF